MIALLASVIVLTALPASNPAGGNLSSAEIAAVIRSLIESGAPVAGSRAEQTRLRALYEPGGYAPLWLDQTGRPDANAREARAVVESAADEGLDPEDYCQPELERLMAIMDASSLPATRDIAGFDVALSTATLRYLRDLHVGRVDPRRMGYRLSVPADRHDLAIELRAAIAEHRIAGVAADLTPGFAQYRLLRGMLTRYRALAADPTLALPMSPSTSLRSGERYAGVVGLRRFLVALGDLPSNTPVPSDSIYDGTIADGVRRFQLRHGLDADGVLGKRTLAALRVPLAWRVRQIELALERLRWLPDLGERRVIVINIPMFRLWAWDAIQDGAPLFAMDVIVGRALGTQTPVFDKEMREVIFRPYWNVPRSILRNEILPAIEKDPGYLQQHAMEIVVGQGDDARTVDFTPESLEGLRAGRYRVRQVPGPENSLGLIKFVFPNEDDVYMHGTPARTLFAQSRRDFSHGCIRVADPVTLAEWALAGDPAWTREAILAAIAGTSSRHVKLARPIDVILFYTTAAVMPEEGTISFADDIYRHDVRLDRALVARELGQ